MAADANEAANLARRLERKIGKELGGIRARIRRALEAGPCDYETLYERVAAEWDAALRPHIAAGVAGLKPMGKSKLTLALSNDHNADFVARVTGMKCDGPRGYYGYLSWCVFEPSPCAGYVAAHPALFREDDQLRLEFPHGVRWSGRLSYLGIYYTRAHLAHAKIQVVGPDNPVSAFYRQDIAIFEAAHTSVAARAAAAGVEPPPRPYFPCDP